MTQRQNNVSRFYFWRFGADWHAAGYVRNQVDCRCPATFNFIPTSNRLRWVGLQAINLQTLPSLRKETALFLSRSADMRRPTHPDPLHPSLFAKQEGQTAL